MITIQESMWDKKLDKFILIFTEENPKITGVRYDKECNCYYILWTYLFNTLTRDHEFYTTHFDMFKTLPDILRSTANSANTVIGLTTELMGTEKELFVAGLIPLKLKQLVDRFVDSHFKGVGYEFDYMDAFRISLLESGFTGRLEESMGDLELKKFIIVFTREIPGASVMKYSNDLKCYYYIWKYKYNWHTMLHDPDTVHAEIFYNVIPEEIRKVATEDNTFVGGTSTYDGKQMFTFSAGLGTLVQQRKVQAFVEKAFPREYGDGQYTYEHESAFEFSL